VLVVSVAGGAVVLAMRRMAPDHEAADSALTRDTEDANVRA
jgi:hypothetical protein